MNSKLLKTMLLVAFAAASVLSARYTVDKSGFGGYQTITEAIEAASDGDEVVILDYETYEEQVTIFEKKNLTLRSENPTSTRKPTIKWKDTENILPQVREDAKDSARINFDQNGALRVMRSTNILIEGIAVDGGGNFPFASKEDVWENTKENKWYPMQHGNAALVLWIAGGVTVRNCDLSNAFFGISFKDRNEGGIFANSNPADIQTWKVVPLSGFGKTGEHVIEYNRIHNNSIGLFYESTWDLGTVVRYNLIYENHHPSGKSDDIKNMSSQGEHLIGGAMMFKDHILSPLAIYNNTFYKNGWVFIGNWRSGGHYLIFNNIIASPYQDPTFENPWQVLDPYFHNRMFNSVYACHVLPIVEQKQPVQVADDDPDNPGAQVRKSVTVYQPRIMNSFGEVEGSDIIVPCTLSSGTVSNQTVRNVKVPGNRIVSSQAGSGYSAANNLRWLETKFKSTDPEESDFLVPDWDDPLIDKYIVDQGYDAVGITDPDGSPADLGAIPKEGGRHSSEIRIKPTAPVSINKGTAVVSFVIEGAIENPKIKYIKWIHELPVDAVFGQKDVIIPKNDIISIDKIPDVKVGNNTLTFTVPSRSDSNLYAFFEIVIEGIDPETKQPVQSVVGSLPYRKIDYEFKVEIFELDGKTQKSTVLAGEQVILKITPLRKDNTPWDSNTPIEQTDVSLFSGFDLLDSTDSKIEVPKFNGNYQAKVKFTKVPSEGIEFVAVGGLFKASNDDFLAIRGTSDQIIIKPGPPDYLEFQSPPSKGVDKIDPGREYDVKIAVYDKYGNKIDQVTDVTLSSEKTDKGDVVGGGPKTSPTDSTGVVHFLVEVIEGAQKNDSIPLVASLKVTGKTDNATLIVGEPRDKLLIFYPGDSAGTEIDEKLSIEGCSDQFIPIVIKRIGKKDNKFVVVAADSDTVSFDIETSSGIGVYLTNEPSAERITKVSKMKGQVTLWIKSTGLASPNGSIRVYPIDNPAVLSGERGKINFIQCNPSILKAAYFADEGDGRVNRMEIYYDDTLAVTEIPDTFQLYWPNRQSEPKIVLGSDLSSVKLDSENKKHLTITLKEPFNPVPLITVNSVPTLGVSYWRNPLLEEAPLIKANFNIDDSVGPLINSAVLVEKLDKSKDDTIYITFTEKVEDIKGESLKLIKKNEGKEVTIEVKEAFNYSGDTIKIVVKSLGDNSPVEGDSLYIRSSGPIIDVNKNHAHKENRPVMIRLKGIQPSINSAYYSDYNGDGKVDFVTVKFNKKVKIDSTELKFAWGDGDSTPTLDKTKGKFSYNGTDSMTLTVEVTGLFRNRIKTSGAMSVEAIYENFGNSRSVWSVDDSAAPVIIEGRLHPGSISDNGEDNQDTLKVTFSEQIKRIESDQEEIFHFYHKDRPYKMDLTKHREEGNNVISFIVDSIIITDEALVKSEFIFPKNNDSLRMSTGKDGIFADDNSNYQKNPANRMAPLRVMAVPTDVEVKVGPMPFIPGRKEVKITVKPRAKMVESCSTSARVTIYDRAGNVVFSKIGDYKPEKGSVELKWKGYNTKGRKVDRGTYMAVVNYSLFLEKGNGKELDDRKTVKIKIAVGKEK